MLLDLLGAKDPTFYNWFPTTSRLYESLKKIGKEFKIFMGSFTLDQSSN